MKTRSSVIPNRAAVSYANKQRTTTSPGPPWIEQLGAKAACSTNPSILCFLLQAFSVIAMFNVMKFSIAILPFSVKAVAEASVSLRRMKV